MKTKNLYLAILCLLTSSILFGQEIELKLNGEYKNLREFKEELSKANIKSNKIHKELYEGLNKKNIKTGFLIEQLIFSKTDIIKYSNVLDTNISSSDWKKIYRQLYLSQYETDILPRMEEIKSKSNDLYNNGFIPIGLINIDYNGIKEEAFKDGRIKFQNNKFYDNSKAINSAYTIDNIKAAAPLFNTTNSLNVLFYIPNELYFTNKKIDIKSIEINFGDGFGFQKVNIESPISISYSNSGIKNIVISLHWNGKKYLFNSKIAVFGENSLKLKSTASGSGSDYQDPEYTKALSDGSRAYIEYGCNNNSKLIKPFVFVEGLNFSPPDECQENNLRYGTFGWDVFRSGTDIPCATDPLNISYLPDLIAKLKSEGFDIVLLDFKDGAGSIEHNADILIELINWINTNLSNNNSNNKLVIAGASMGGVVTRFALSKMEQTSQDHNTRLYLSLDAPHNGANIPLGDQYLLAFFSAFDKITEAKPEVEEAHNKLQKMAPKQLLNYHSQGNGGIVSHWHENLINHQYYKFPTQPYSIGISNGSGNATDQGYSPGVKMVDIDESEWRLGIRVARIQGEPYAISDGSKYFWGKVYILPNVTEVEYSCNNCKPFDSSPGATRNTNQEIGQGSEIYPHHCFIPTISSLSLNTENLSYNVLTSPLITNYPYIRANNSDLCPFDMIYINEDDANEDHVETTFENISWITNKTSPEDLMLQNINLDGRYEARNTISVGRDIFSNDNSPDIGDVNIYSGKNVELVAGQSITIQPGFTIQKGATFSASIDDFCPEYNMSTLKSTNTSNKTDENLSTSNFIYKVVTDERLIQKENNYISIYPNPSKGEVNINVTLPDMKEYKIQIINSLGDIIRENKTKQSIYKLNLKNELPGVYIVRISVHDKVISRKLIIE